MVISNMRMNKIPEMNFFHKNILSSFKLFAFC